MVDAPILWQGHVTQQEVKWGIGGEGALEFDNAWIYFWNCHFATTPILKQLLFAEWRYVKVMDLPGDNYTA